MLPIGPLMIEHRVIEKMIGLLAREARRMEREQTVITEFLDSVVNFIVTYGDRCHHGKEEDILFKALSGKPLRDDDRRLMDELIAEHRQAWDAILELDRAKKRYAAGERQAIAGILSQARILTDLYPRHIEKEDKRFFPASMEYLSPEEKDRMLGKEFEYDRRLFHDIFREAGEAAERLLG